MHLESREPRQVFPLCGDSSMGTTRQGTDVSSCAVLIPRAGWAGVSSTVLADEMGKGRVLGPRSCSTLSGERGIW